MWASETTTDDKRSGSATVSELTDDALRQGVEMPITEQMAAILENGKSPQDAIRELMARPGRDE